MSTVYAIPRTAHRAPLAAQAVSLIRRAVLDGHWQVGMRLPSEPELAAELGISRATLREALRTLVSDGLLDRRHGVGTFVLRVPTPTIERGIDELFSLGDAIEQLGYEPSVGERAGELLSAVGVVATELGIAEGQPICHLTRVRLADGRPVIICHDYFPDALLDGIGLASPAAVAEVVDLGSLYAWFEQRLGIVIDWALTHIEPVAAGAAESEVLGVRQGEALIRLRQTHYAVDGRPVLYSENVHNGDVIRFHVQRRRARPTIALTESGTMEGR